MEFRSRFYVSLPLGNAKGIKSNERVILPGRLVMEYM